MPASKLRADQRLKPIKSDFWYTRSCPSSNVSTVEYQDLIDESNSAAPSAPSGRPRTEELKMLRVSKRNGWFVFSGAGDENGRVGNPLAAALKFSRLTGANDLAAIGKVLEKLRDEADA